MIFGACATTILTTPPKKVSVGGENLSLLSMRNDVDDATTETTTDSAAQQHIKWS